MNGCCLIKSRMFFDYERLIYQNDESDNPSIYKYFFGTSIYSLIKDKLKCCSM